MAAKILTWDWKEQPDAETLSRHLVELAGVWVREITDTGTDQFAWVFSDEPLTEEQAYSLYREWYEKEE